MISATIIAEIERVVKNHLRGEYCEALTRFSYLNGGAEEFVQLTHNPDYTSYDREIILLRQLLTDLRNRIGSETHVIDFGVGDGTKANIVTALLGQNCLSYTGLDMSTEMIARARSNNSFFNSAYTVCDFSNTQQTQRALQQVPESNRLFLLLGNTITNEVNMQEYLRSLRNIMGTGGQNYLLLGLELLQDPEQLLREYRTEENYALTFRPLSFLGIPRDHSEISIDFNHELQRIEEWFVFSRTGSVRGLEYQENNRVLLSITNKPTLVQMRNIITRSGWSEALYVIDDNYVVFLLS